jgi:hypothetical protein
MKKLNYPAIAIAICLPLSLVSTGCGDEAGGGNTSVDGANNNGTDTHIFAATIDAKVPAMVETMNYGVLLNDAAVDEVPIQVTEPGMYKVGLDIDGYWVVPQDVSLKENGESKTADFDSEGIVGLNVDEQTTCAYTRDGIEGNMEDKHIRTYIDGDRVVIDLDTALLLENPTVTGEAFSGTFTDAGGNEYHVSGNLTPTVLVTLKVGNEVIRTGRCL